MLIDMAGRARVDEWLAGPPQRSERAQVILSALEVAQ